MGARVDVETPAGTPLTALIDGVGSQSTQRFDQATDMAERLLDAQADVNGVDQLGRTPLFASLKTLSQPFARIFLKRGADPNRATNKGETPLGLVLSDTAMTKALLDAGADPNTSVADGGEVRCLEGVSAFGDKMWSGSSKCGNYLPSFLAFFFCADAAGRCVREHR